MHVRVVAHITARPETLPAVREVLVGFIEPTRKEAGCLSYELLQDNAAPCQSSKNGRRTKPSICTCGHRSRVRAPPGSAP
jgi:hypothetical protein